MPVHDIYCVICGIQAKGIHWYENDLEELKYILNKGKYKVPSKSKKHKLSLGSKEKEISPKIKDSYKNFIKDMNKIKKNFNWCNKCILVTDKKVVKINNKYDQDDRGGFIINNQEYNTEKFLWGTSTRALICHQSCYKLLSDKLKYKLKIDDIQDKINDHSLLKRYGKDVDKYSGAQDFPWTWMILGESPFNIFEILLDQNKKIKISKNLNYLIDPLKNKQNEDRITKIWKPIISKVKKKSHLKKDRPSPSESATLYDVGKKKKGNDGNIYEVVVNKNNVKRWKKSKK